MYLDDPVPALRALRSQVAAGAPLSLLEKNRAGLALRPGLRGDYGRRPGCSSHPSLPATSASRTGRTSVDEWRELLAANGWGVDSWVGIRLFSDQAPDDLPAARLEELATLEREAGRRDPYRAVARLIHIAATAV